MRRARISYTQIRYLDLDPDNYEWPDGEDPSPEKMIESERVSFNENGPEEYFGIFEDKPDKEEFSIELVVEEE